MDQSFPVLISQTLIAFTIEHDNVWEARYWLRADPAPLRTSLVMWANFVRFLPEEGISVRELSQKAGYPPGKAHPDLTGMIRWRYVTVDSQNVKKPKLGDRIMPTERALEAAQTWIPLAAEIEKRWEKRFGSDKISRMKGLLIEMIKQFDQQMPHYFPVLYHLRGMSVPTPHEPESDPTETLALPYLLSQVHLLFTLEANQLSDLSLVIRANVLRVSGLDPISKKELPQLSGISKEALSMCINYLKKRELMVEEPGSDGKGKFIRLTEAGLFEKNRYSEIVQTVEDNWLAKLPEGLYLELHQTLLEVVQPEVGADSPLFDALILPHPDLWRAKEPKRRVLPHHPMVLYRGGWPDGS
ncbi:MAG: hypothetical protein AAF633_08880 [Chloroflexota bacterium]